MRIRGLLVCLALCTLFVCISSWSVLEFMKDLKEKTNFGKHFPRQGLLLLCWLLNQGQIDQNGKLQLNFNPAEKPYGFHEYKNYDLTFPDLSNKMSQYFSLGNLYLRKAKQLPEYIMKSISKSDDHPESNIDRVVIQVQKENPTRVEKVYITQHAGDRNQGSDYVKEFTYLIGEQLLKEIAELCRPSEEVSKREDKDKDDPDYQRFRNIQNTFQSYPHLHLFLYQTGYVADNNAKEHAESNSQAKSTAANIKLELRSTWKGKARLVWDRIPAEMLKHQMKIGIYKNEDEDTPLLEFALNKRTHGEIDTDLDLNPGLQLRLLKSITVDETVYESPEFDGSKGQRHHPAPSTSFFGRLISLVLWPFSSLFSLVFFILGNLFSLVYSVFSHFFSLVFFIVSTPFLIAFRVFSYLNALVDSVVNCLLSLVSNILSIMFPSFLINTLCQLISLVLLLVLKLAVVLIFIILFEVARRMIFDVPKDRPRAAPHFVDVSPGRPGL